MNISDTTTKSNINKGILKREKGMVYGTIDKEKGKTYVDMVWLGTLPLAKGEQSIQDILGDKDKKIKRLEENIIKLEKRVEVLSKTLQSFLQDIENSMKEDF